MALEQDIQDLTRNIDDLNDSFEALNRTMANNLRTQGTEVQKTATSAKKAADALKDLGQEAERTTSRSVRQARSEAQRQIEEARYHRTWMGRMEQQAGANVEAQKSLIRMAGALDGVNRFLGTVGKTAMALGKAMYEGQLGASANNSAIEAASKGFKDFAGNFGIIGKIIGGLVGLFGDWLQETNKLSDRLYTAYSEIARVGVAAGDGMRGAADAAVRLGFGLSDAGIQNFIKLLKGAAGDLALLSGSALEGRRQFVNLAEQIIDRGPVQQGLMNLGMSVEDINQGIANFIQNQVGLGVASQRTNRELVRGSIEYIKQLDLIAKLTGQQADDMQQQIDANRRNERFRAAIEKTRLEEGEDAARNLELNMAAIAKVAPDTAKGLMDIAAGFVTTKEAQQVLQSGMMGIPDLMKRQLGGGFQELGMAARQTASAYGTTLGAVGAFSDVFGSLYEQYKLGNMSFQDYNTALAEAIRQQKLQEKGADGLVGAQTNMRIAQMDTRDSLQQLGVVTASVTTPALVSLAQAASSAAQVLGGAVRTTTGIAGGAAAGAAIGSVVPGVGTLVGGIAGGIAGGLTGFLTRGGTGTAPGAAGRGPVGATPESLFNFQGGISGNRANFDSLNPAFRDRLLAMAAEYNQITGNKLTFGSGQRNQEQNAQVGGVGTSLHLQGRAADLSTDSVNALKAQGLLDRYGFRQNPRSAWHISDSGFQMGGIASGPKSGYNALLHGTEAIVPLPDGRTIPVEMPNLDRNMEQQVSMMGAQLIALEEMVRYLRDNNSISTKILQAANN